jgi:hypothetical protein
VSLGIVARPHQPRVSVHLTARAGGELFACVHEGSGDSDSSRTNACGPKYGRLARVVAQLHRKTLNAAKGSMRALGQRRQ